MPLSANRVFSVMDDLIAGRSYSITNWIGSRYELLRVSSPSDKGNLGEDLIHNILHEIGYMLSNINSNRKGDWDIITPNGNLVAKFEVKVATLDTNDSHQFNGIRYDAKYTHLFLLGVSPNELKYKIVAKIDLNKFSLVSTQKGANAAFKLTMRTNELNSFNDFETEMFELLGKPVKNSKLD